MQEIEIAAKTALVTCLSLGPDESILIVTDKGMLNLAEYFLGEAKKITKDADFIEYPPGKVNGEEPPKYVADALMKTDCAILITTKSISHTKARKYACRNGARMASLPGATAEMLKRCLPIDYAAMKVRTTKLAKIFLESKSIRVTTALGTDITVPVGPKVFEDDGLYTKKGDFGNLPAGEAGFGPAEGKTNGIFIVDACMGFGILKTPIKITVKDGFAIKFEGPGKDRLLSMFQGLPNDAFNIAEFAIGTNPSAKITGIVLEDEKVLGTCHIALGNNKSFGGTVDVPIHIDGIIKAPTIYADRRKIMENGKLLI